MIVGKSAFFGNKSLSGSLIGGIDITQEMLDFCGKHNITSDVEVIPIHKINKAFERMLRSDVKCRFCIDMASVKELLNNKIAANYRRLDRVGDLVRGVVYFPDSLNFSIVVPRLTKGVINIYQKNSPLEQGEPSTFTAKFADNSFKIAAVNSIELDWIPKDTVMLSHFKKQQVHLVESLDVSTYQFCEMEGKYGPGLELIVFNQTPHFEWPHRTVKRDGNSKSIGIRREFHIEQSVVEFSMVLPIDSDDIKKDAIGKARKAMDVFMGGYKVLANKANE